jgi:hypothetical protein
MVQDGKNYGGMAEQLLLATAKNKGDRENAVAYENNFVAELWHD